MAVNEREDQLRKFEEIVLSLMGILTIGGLIGASIFFFLRQLAVALCLAGASALFMAGSLGFLFFLRNCRSMNTVPTYRPPDTNTLRCHCDTPPPDYTPSWGATYSERARNAATPNQMDGNSKEMQRHLEGAKSSSETKTMNFSSSLPKIDVSNMQSSVRQSVSPVVFVSPVNDRPEMANYDGQVTGLVWQCQASGSVPTNPTLGIGTHGRNAPNSSSYSRLEGSTFQGSTEGRFLHAITLNDGAITVSAPSFSLAPSSTLSQYVGLEPSDDLPSYEEATMLRADALQVADSISDPGIAQGSCESVQPALDFQSDPVSVHASSKS